MTMMLRWRVAAVAGFATSSALAACGSFGTDPSANGAGTGDGGVAAETAASPDAGPDGAQGTLTDGGVSRVVIAAAGERLMRTISLDEGATWTDGYAAESDGGGEDAIMASTFGKGAFVGLAGGRYVGTSRVLRTVDGVAWSTPPALGDDIQSVVFDGRRFLAGTTNRVLYVSSDAMSWTRLETEGEFRVMVAYGGRLLAGGFGNLWSSVDGQAWTGIAVPETSNTAYWGGAVDLLGNLMFVTEVRSILVREGPVVDAVATLPPAVRRVAFGNGRWVTTDGLGSTDGRTWTRVHSTNLTAITFGAGAFYGAFDHNVYRSTDGIAWLLLHTANAPASGGFNTISVGTL